MSKLPEAFVKKMKSDLGSEADLFFESLSSSSPTSIRYNPNKSSSVLFKDEKIIPWAEHGRYLEVRPSFTFDPYFHAGYYYVQEASSMFLEQIFKQHIPSGEKLKVLDLSAAPGGKTTHLLSLISKDSLLISNEVIQARASILVENITRWGNSNVVVTNNDPEHFSMFDSCFDVVVVDAPCSGEGMFRKDPDSINEWSEDNVALCSARQKRILHPASQLLKPGGLLIYSTCTYNKEEDFEPLEQISQNGNFESLNIDLSNFPGVVEREVNGITGYHFYPHKIKGEGYFISVLKNSTDYREGTWPKVAKKTILADKKTINLISEYVDLDAHDILQHDGQSLAFPNSLKNEMLGLLSSSLRIKKFGVNIGQLIRDELIPDQALAMGLLNLKKTNELNLSEEEAIMYLQKKDFNPSVNTKGWHLVKYNGAPLGFAKVMGNRMNNTYPKEWRIRSEKTVL